MHGSSINLCQKNLTFAGFTSAIMITKSFLKAGTLLLCGLLPCVGVVCQTGKIF